MSRITKVEVTTFTLPCPNFARDYNYPISGSLVYQPDVVTDRKGLLVQVHTEDGLTGEYVDFTMAGAPEQAVEAARSAIGHQWHERELIFRKARRAARPAHNYGLSFLDTALWDLAGKAYGVPLYQMLGGFRKNIPAYFSCHNGDRLGNLSSKEAVADFARSVLDLGFGGFKMHSWHEGNKREEAENVHNLRKVLGDKVELMLDPACVFDSLSDAIYVGKACEDAGFKWYEDPLRPLGIGIHAHKQLREALNIPILQTEHVPGPEAKADFLLNGGTDLLRVDVRYDLGVTGCLKTIRFAESIGVNVEPHGPSPVHRHLIAAMQNTSWYEVANVSPAMEDPSPLVYTCGYNDNYHSIAKDGTLPVPQLPGVGVEYDHALIASRKLATVVVE
ncbi:enolase C-terminal domain-like protein [Paracandidimonas soli]|uniref:L-alanine-DL-glutamate epimerase-like enolase superfamily enzyme n=1 Tax=Paracandidimonas soli TaxID=1917182 RepID=A0A4R3VEX0_9BURK|nr:enolase C-terminal domain-like protein [Paracandidimonas soli]TCV01315.1 L-alanine-DL-glutamate epimerase-like enolase superfamily enzyme [Paracandidimonas soli]